MSGFNDSVVSGILDEMRDNGMMDDNDGGGTPISAVKRNNRNQQQEMIEDDDYSDDDDYSVASIPVKGSGRRQMGRYKPFLKDAGIILLIILLSFIFHHQRFSGVVLLPIFPKLGGSGNYLIYARLLIRSVLMALVFFIVYKLALSN